MRCLALALLLAVCACGSVGRPGTPTGAPLSTTDLQYRLIDRVGAPVYCDPRQYPVARPDDPVEDARMVSDLRSRHPAEFEAIVRHEHLDPANLSPADNARIVGQVALLAAVPLTGQGDVYDFAYEVVGPPPAEVRGTIDSRGAIRVASRVQAPRRPCPICLAQWARIAAPGGDVAVDALRVGALVWTANAAGQRIAEPVVAVGHTPTPPGHQVVHLVLAGGRAVDVSPGHPLSDGRRVGDLRAGDLVDGSAVLSAQRLPYAGDATWDLLPAGLTHVYWADGVPLASTLTQGA